MPVVLFAAGGLSWCIAGLFRGTSILDLQLHDTYYVVSGVMLEKWVAIFLFIISGIYLLFSKAFTDGWLYKISYVHFWVTFIGCYLLFWRNTYEGMAGMPRRYYDYGHSFESFMRFNRMIGWTALMIVVMQVVFVGMIAYSGLRKRFFTRY